MDRDEFHRMLRIWGYDFGEPRPREWDEGASSVGASALSCALDGLQRRGVAPKREPFGEVRRMVGKILIVRELRLTAKGKQSQGGGKIWRPRPESAAIERAWSILYAESKEYAMILRSEHCRRGNRAEKRGYVAEYLKLPRMSGLRYRRGLRDGREKLFEIYLTRIRKTG